MLKLYGFLRIKSKELIYFAKLFVLAADMKIIGDRSAIVTEYDI